MTLAEHSRKHHEQLTASVDDQMSEVNEHSEINERLTASVGELRLAVVSR